SVGLDIAKQGLRTTSEQTAILTRNVTRADDPYASRKVAHLITSITGGARLGTVQRLADEALLENLMRSASSHEAQLAIADALDALDATVGDPELGASPAAMMQELMDSLQEYAARPHDAIAARAALDSAVRVAESLNNASQEVRTVRERADADINR